MLIESIAPTRVDLAGGTIDIWPLYLFHPGAATVNFGVSLYARCRIETRADDKIILESRDRGLAFETNLAGIPDLAHEERLELISKLVHFFKPEVGFHLIAESTAPAGAGLGGSSAPAVACIRARNRPGGGRHPESKFIITAPNITTPHMERIVEKALANGAEAAKVCGAGGGGCIAFLCADGRRAEVERALSAEEDVQMLDWHFAPEGLIVRES